RVLSQYEPVIWPRGNGPLRLPPRSGTGGHACNGKLIGLAGRPEISRNRIVSFGFERTLVAARCQAIGCFLWLLQRRLFRQNPSRHGGFRVQDQVHRCYLAANNSENSKLPSNALKTKRRATTGDQ